MWTGDRHIKQRFEKVHLLRGSCRKLFEYNIFMKYMPGLRKLTFKILIVIVNSAFSDQLKSNLGKINTLTKKKENSKNIYSISSYLDSNESSQ